MDGARCFSSQQLALQTVKVSVIFQEHNTSVTCGGDDDDANWGIGEMMLDVHTSMQVASRLEGKARATKLHQLHISSVEELENAAQPLHSSHHQQISDPETYKTLAGGLLDQRASIHQQIVGAGSISNLQHIVHALLNDLDKSHLK